MIISIRSLAGSIKKYEGLLNQKLRFNDHYHVIKEGIIPNYYHPELPGQPYVSDELAGITVHDLDDLFDIFEGFKEGMGEGTGHITIDIKNNIVYVLDSWIE